MSETESEFEKVDDWESVSSNRDTGRGEDTDVSDDGKVDDDQNITKPRVVVELPAPLLLKSAPQQQEDTGDKSTTTESFSFVKRMENLNVAASSSSSSANSCTTNSSWSRVEAAGGGDSANSSTCSAAASSVSVRSTISGFNLLSIKHHSCLKCSFRYQPNDTICGGCGVALMANPCPDVDEQVARNLQLKEEELALQAIEQEEKKRKTLHQEPVFCRSRILVDRVESFVRGCGGGMEGFGTLPAANMVVLASRLIDNADSSTFSTGGTKVSLVYHFSRKFEWRMEKIRQDGLGAGARTSTNIQAAYDHPGNNEHPGNRRVVGTATHQQRPWRNRDTMLRLSSIPEDKTSDSTGLLGWIVATTRPFPHDLNEQIVKVSSGSATIMTQTRCGLDFPLVCFDASLRHDDIIRRLLNGLSQIFFDFFQTPEEALVGQKEIEDMITADRMFKKAKVLPNPSSVRDDDDSSLKSLQETLERTSVSRRYYEPIHPIGPSSAEATVASRSVPPSVHQVQESTSHEDEELDGLHKDYEDVNFDQKVNDLLSGDMDEWIDEFFNES